MKDCKFMTIVICCILLLSCKKNVQGQQNNTDPPMAATDTVTTSTINFKGVNWADPRDNFADDWLVLSGLSVTDNETAILSKTDSILSAFREAGSNTVRIPVNPPTVLQSYWTRYAAIISEITAKKMKVILGYWEGASSKDGKVDDTASFRMMWDVIVTKFKLNQNVYFEIMNEPHGYDSGDLKKLYTGWLARYSDVPRRRILLDGTGYATGVNDIGADNRFDSCLLSFHYYTWFNSGYQTTADWELPIKNLSYPKRTVMTEFGVPMTDGEAYTDAPRSDNSVTYLQGITSQLHSSGIGCIYWPGLRTGDSYSMFTYDNGMKANNESGLTLLKHAWGMGHIDTFYADIQENTDYKIINRNSNKSLDVNGSSTADGADIIQWDYWGGDNQQWAFKPLGNGYYNIINKNSNKALEVSGSSTDGSAAIVQEDGNGNADQQWQIINIGFGYNKIINRNSGLSLDVNGRSTSNGGNIIQWYWNNGFNQQWQITTL